MLLHWYACISMNTYYYKIYHISLETVWWALSNTSTIIWIWLAIHEILANKDFTFTDDLISQLFVVTFVHPVYVQIALIWGFTAQLSLWKLVHLLWRYKLNEVCDTPVSSGADHICLFYLRCPCWSRLTSWISILWYSRITRNQDNLFSGYILDNYPRYTN